MGLFSLSFGLSARTEDPHGGVCAVRQHESDLNAGRSLNNCTAPSSAGHPNIIGVLGCVRTGANKEPPMLVLELCTRGDLKAFLATASRKGTAVMPGALLRFGREVAQALGFLEAHAILHRDLAARNVLLTEDATCKLADFGLVII